MAAISVLAATTLRSSLDPNRLLSLGDAMPTRFLSDAELAQLAGFPADIAGEDLVTYFTLEPDDDRWALRDHRGHANRLGFAILVWRTLNCWRVAPTRRRPADPPRCRRRPGRSANFRTPD